MQSLQAARLSASSVDQVDAWGKLCLSVRGYRRPILHPDSKVGPLRAALVTGASFVTAYKTRHSSCEGEETVGQVLRRRCNLCRKSCPRNGKCGFRTATVTSICGVPGCADGLGGLAEPSAAAERSKTHLDACYCCSVRNVTDADPLEPVLVDVGDEKAARKSVAARELLVVASPDLQYLSRSSVSPHAVYCSSQNPVAPVSLLDGVGGTQQYQIGSGVETGADLGGILEKSGVSGPAVEWFSCLPVQNAGRVLMVAGALVPKCLAVPLQSSDVRPSPFDIRKRSQLRHLPNPLDNRHGGHCVSSTRPEAGTTSPLPPSALPPFAVGGLRGSPKVFVLTTRFIVPIKFRDIAQIFVKAVEMLTMNAGDASGLIQQQQRQQQLILRQYQMVPSFSLSPIASRSWLHRGVAPLKGGMVLEGQAQWQSLLMLTHIMFNDQQFTRDQMFAAFWQLLVDRWAERTSLPFSLTAGNPRAQEIDVGDVFDPGQTGANPTLLGRQLGALRSSKGLYMPPAGAGMTGGGGQFQTPFGMGYVERTRQNNSGARMTQTTAHPSEDVACSGVAQQQDTDAYGGALSLAWYFLTDMTAREESGVSVFGGVDSGCTSMVGSFHQQRIPQQQQQKAPSDSQPSWSVMQAKLKPFQGEAGYDGGNRWQHVLVVKEVAL